MHTRLVTTLVMVVCLLLMGGRASAQPQLPAFRSGDVIRADDLNRIVGQIRRNTSALDGVGGATHTVDCEAGETIANAMSQAHPGSTIMISGTCEEAVLVDRDGITLDGGGTAVIDGMKEDAAAIKIRGQQNVTIKGLTVQNGLNGIKIVEGAAAWLEDVTVQNSRVKVGHDSGAGIVVAGSASAVLTGSIVSSDNDSFGVGVWHRSSIVVISNVTIDGDELPRASLEANRNGTMGIEISLGSLLHAFSGDSMPTTIQANNNGENGINVALSGSVQFGGGADVEAVGNGQSGLSLFNGSSVTMQTWGSPARGVTARFNDNEGWAGISVYDHSSLVLSHNDDVTTSITAENNTGVGIGVGQNSSARFGTSFPQSTSASVTFSNNGSHGGGVYQNATVTVRVPAEVNDNANDGFEIWGNCFVDLGPETDGVVAFNDNGGNGISVYLATAPPAPSPPNPTAAMTRRISNNIFTQKRFA